MKQKNSSPAWIGVCAAVTILILIGWFVLYTTDKRVKNSRKMLQQAEAILTPSVAMSMEISQIPSQPILTVEPTQETSTSGMFSGKITEVDNKLPMDGSNKIKVNGDWIMVNMGGDPTVEVAKARGPRGSITLADGTRTGAIGTDKIGQTVEVSVKQLPDGTYTLYGSSEYYIKFK